MISDCLACFAEYTFQRHPSFSWQLQFCQTRAFRRPESRWGRL